MNMPGFGAEVSLYKTSAYYHLTSGLGGEATSRVVPNLFYGCTPCSPSGWQYCCPMPRPGQPPPICRSVQCTPPPDPCADCKTVRNPCLRLECLCECDGGNPVPGPGRCGFVCT